MSRDEADQFGLRRRFFAECPPEFLRAFMKGHIEAYRSAWDLSDRRWPEYVARDARPIVCRADIEAMWQMLKVEFPGLVDVQEKLHPKNNSSHMELTCGSFRITECIVADPSQPVNEAEYRRNLALVTWLPLPEFGPPPSDGLCVVFFIHGADRRDLSRMAFGHMIFPGRDCKDILHRIDLLDWYYNNLAQDADQERVADPAALVRTTGRRLITPPAEATEGEIQS